MGGVLCSEIHPVTTLEDKAGNNVVTETAEDHNESELVSNHRDTMATVNNKKIQLKCKAPNGQHCLTDIKLNITVGSFKQIISEVSNIPKERIKLRQGYPPKIVKADNEDAKLDTLPFRSGDTFLVEEDKSTDIPAPNRADRAFQSQMLSSVKGMLIRRVVPANNSCLFTAVNLVMNGGELDVTCAKAMRILIATCVKEDEEYYNSGFLGKTNDGYCRWIQNDQSWGGGIELSILTRYYKVEIDVLDTQTGRIDRFGEDKNYAERVLLLYDGVHYDALILEPTDPTKSVETIFPTSDEMILAQALELAAEAKASRQFTDVCNFSLRCLICQTGLRGSEEAQVHAKKTGHVNFGEY